MHVLRGRAETPTADREITRRLASHVIETDRAGLRVWYPHKQLAFGPRDTGADEYARARRVADRNGFDPVEREVGGRAVAFTGKTLAFVVAEPRESDRRHIQARYEETLDRLEQGLRMLDVEPFPGEPANSFCPGTQSLQIDGKVAGVAQRVRDEVALVAGVVVVGNRNTFVDVLDRVYGALGIEFDPDTVDSIERAADGVSTDDVRDAVEGKLVGDRSPVVSDVRKM